MRFAIVIKAKPTPWRVAIGKSRKILAKSRFVDRDIKRLREQDLRQFCYVNKKPVGQAFSLVYFLYMHNGQAGTPVLR
jgi:hypothetical protein